MRLFASCVIALCLIGATACSLPRVHKVSVQQGNVITQDMIDRLKPGMTRSQVAYVMGEPVYRNPFEDDRWDYVYTLEVPGFFDQQQRMSLYFEDDLLAYFTGDYAPTTAKEQDAAPATADTGNGEDEDEGSGEES